MKLKTIHLSFIRSFKEQSFNPNTTRVIVGQNDQGKSSLLKALNIVFNEITEQHIEAGQLPSKIAERLLPSFPVGHKSRRITITFSDSTGSEGQLYLTFRQDFSFDVRLDTKKGGATTPAAKEKYNALREKVKFILIPAVRDAQSDTFSKLLSRTLDKYGVENLIPKEVGGTTKQYRALKDITKKIKEVVTPFIASELAPKIKETLGIQTDEDLSVSFSADPKIISEWIKQNLKLSVTPTSEEASEIGDTVPLTETGSGIQSAVLLSLHRLELASQKHPDKEYIFAIEEPEAFLHPQKQKELFESIKPIQSSNLTVLVTSHSPYIVSSAEFSEIGVVKKIKGVSKLVVPEIINENEKQVFSFYSNEVNSQIFFAERIIFVEGESDRLVFREILKKKFPKDHYKWTIIQAAGNRNFSPYLRMIQSIKDAKIPFCVLTDFDSLTASTERAIVRGVKDAGFKVPEKKIADLVDDCLDKGETEFRKCAKDVSKIFSDHGVRVFILPSDLEFSLVTEKNKSTVAEIISGELDKKNYKTGYDLNQIRRLIGSKGIPLQDNEKAKFKKPFIHRKIACHAMSIENWSEEVDEFMEFVC